MSDTLELSCAVDRNRSGMRSVPPRGSGWVGSLPIADCRFPIVFARLPIGIWQSATGNAPTHPLPRGGTDLIVTETRLRELRQN